MIRRTPLLTASLIAASLPCITVAQSLSIVTAPAGSYIHSAGSAIAKVVTEKTKLKVVLQAQAGIGFEEVDSGAGDFNLSNAFDGTFYATGTGEYQGKGPKPAIRRVAALMPYRVAIFVRNDSSIRNLSDLKGKRISSEFVAMKTIARMVGGHLANAGLTWADVVGVPAPNPSRQVEDFMSGKVDAFFFAFGAGAVKQASASVGGIRALDADTSPEAVKRLQELMPGAYVVSVAPGPGLDGISRPTSVVAFDMVMFTNVKVSDESVYRMVKAIYENKGELAASFPPFGQFNPQDMAKPIEAVPAHPGALRFYREVGLSK